MSPAPPETIVCPHCQQPATYQGTQDAYAVYRCLSNHLIRIPVTRQ